MEQLLYKTFDYVEGIGITNVIVLCGIIAFLCLLYLSIVLESYSNLGSIRDVLNFGKYQVDIVLDSETKERRIVKAWNTANAVERVAKNLDTLDSVTFLSTKLSGGASDRL